ncbi:sulfurtransferase-like selenium metabolism protein YedF [Halarcobacter sp.]|uniref:sulfurtransferase-like selenium metabolism protein YedF n=1 Tax=Halarcobacter sp. TaxID=2321133 RepID=UPI002AA6DEC9|nr:sulfurtransferase-like selenium metabolism protein YedF [Halarcobacter sp.]|eukprot:Anaeramoba_ignava/a97499_12.p1 GENE.a97499_12~~a97499_12.p1  ORF type:complete len:114 (-),score=10.39 a97499_12:165-506(-)
MSKNKKTVFLKSNKIGEGELGSILINGFLKAMTEQENLPEKIICVNSAVLLTTSKDEDEVLNSLKELEQKGVKILSCGTCLDYYNVRDELKVGLPGNALDTVETLLNEDVVTF